MNIDMPITGSKNSDPEVNERAPLRYINTKNATTATTRMTTHTHIGGRD